MRKSSGRSTFKRGNKSSPQKRSSSTMSVDGKEVFQFSLKKSFEMDDTSDIMLELYKINEADAIEQAFGVVDFPDGLFREVERDYDTANKSLVALKTMERLASFHHHNTGEYPTYLEETAKSMSKLYMKDWDTPQKILNKINQMDYLVAPTNADDFYDDTFDGVINNLDNYDVQDIKFVTMSLMTTTIKY